MGMNTYIKGDNKLICCQVLKELGLNDSLRHCHIPAWADRFEMTTGLDIDIALLSGVMESFSGDVLREWTDRAWKTFDADNDIHTLKICMYLEVCVAHNVAIVIG